VLLTNPKVPAKSFKEFIAYARQHPGKLNYGSPGIGSAPHLVTELIKERTGTRIEHVTYKGGAPMLQALINDEVQVAVADLSTSLAWIRAGRVKPLAMLSARRSSLLPDVPTLMEEGVLDAPADFWVGLAAAAGTPPAIVNQLNAALKHSLEQPEMREFFAKTGAEPAYSSPKELRDLWVSEQQLWSKVIQSNNIRAE
jgi:tripartite-type tricarboxylate transporter receptor subunit TctC